jgi:hypothetical protein
MKENIFRNILDIAKKLELHVGFEQQIRHSGSSERQKTKLCFKENIQFLLLNHTTVMAIVVKMVIGFIRLVYV